MRLLGEVFLSRHPSPFEAYLALERRLIDHWVTLRRGTPAEFVERARVDAARVMLESSRAPLKTVAYQCGFRDAQHMRSVFNRRLGVTPQQFRLNFAAPV
ncbi:MAG: helix-turn-helix domain-containing protein [Rhodanobacter sp.]